MNLYLLSQGDNTGYDTYDSCVVAANDESEARMMTPWEYGFGDTWARSVDGVTVKLIGVAVEGTEPGTIIASFNAG